MSEQSLLNGGAVILGQGTSTEVTSTPPVETETHPTPVKMEDFYPPKPITLEDFLGKPATPATQNPTVPTAPTSTWTQTAKGRDGLPSLEQVLAVLPTEPASALTHAGIRAALGMRSGGGKTNLYAHMQKLIGLAGGKLKFYREVGGMGAYRYYKVA